ncbi:MAG: hypothetical protein E7131_05285 [Rikenellaceae bacterium]|nr:hypothetical protein [Rikenellaceae bacterium]
MIKFDKIKIVSSIANVKSLNEDVFENKVKDGCIVEQRYTMMSPYYLYIEADYREQELILEFTGKILKDDYKDLIHINNIHTCLSNINDLGLCSLDIDGILQDGVIVKADVCMDVDYPDCKTLTENLRASVGNFKKYLVRNIGDNFVIEKNVQTKSYKRRLTIYDKGKELQKAGNRSFILSLDNPQLLLDYFNDKIRFELNLNSKEQIRRSLNIYDTSIRMVLNSTATPIWDVLDNALVEADNEIVCTDIGELKNKLLLDFCGNDLAKVEALLRNYYSKGTHISQVMKPYRVLAAKLAENLTPSLKQQLRNLLLEVLILFGIFI